MTHIKLLLTAFFWGGTFIAGRIVAREMDPYVSSFFRFAIASIFLLAITIKSEGGLPALKKGLILPVLLLGFTGVFSYNAFFFTGLHYIQASRASLIIALNPIMISLLSAVIYKERLDWIKGAGIIISVTGAMIVISNGRLTEILSHGIGRGELCIFGCVASWVAYSLIGKSVMNGLSPLAAVCYSSLVGTAALFFPAWNSGGLRKSLHFTGVEWISLFYLGFFGTVLGFYWYYQGIKKIGPMKAGVFINFVPVSAVILAYFILGEAITWSLFLGALLVVGGVYTTTASALLKRKKNRTG